MSLTDNHERERFESAIERGLRESREQTKDIIAKNELARLREQDAAIKVRADTIVKEFERHWIASSNPAYGLRASMPKKDHT